MRIGRRRRMAGAIALGAGLGLWLLSWMGPGELAHAERPAREAAAKPRVERQKRDLVVRRAAPPPPAEAAVAEAAPEVVEEEAPPEATKGVIVVDVVDEEGRPAENAFVVAVDCPGFKHGPPGEYLVDVGPCTLRPMRRDGALLARGPAVTVEVGGPDPAYAMLELSGKRTGGIGIRFQPVTGGMQVVDVAPGTPAADAGLQPGDVVVAVGDEAVVDMTTEAFVEAMTGPEGTEVEFTLGFQSDTGVNVETVRLERAFLDG